MTFLKLILFFSVIPLALKAYEVDQFTDRDAVPKDSLAVLDQEINLRIRRALDKTNSGVLGTDLGKLSCLGSRDDQQRSRFKLFENLQSMLATMQPVGLLENFAEKNKSVAKRTIPMDESIYAEAQDKSEILKKFGIGSVINVGGTQIGTDKLGHFFNEGHSLYLSYYKQQDDIQRKKSILLDSKDSENGFFGIKTTKIKSYADMAANYDGSQFWNKLCGWPSKDMSESKRQYFEKFRCNDDAYLKCEGGKWVQNPNQPFTLKDYVNPAWDESINCNSYDEAISDMVFSRMTRTVFKNKNIKQPCPAEPKKCLEITEKYLKRVTNQVINPICKNVALRIKKKELINPNEKFDYTYDPQGDHKSKKESKKEKSAN